MSQLHQILCSVCYNTVFNVSEFFWQGIGETNGRRPTNADLAGFWDMVMIQVCASNGYHIFKNTVVTVYNYIHCLLYRYIKISG